MTEQDRAAILAELAQFVDRIEPLREDEFTARDFEEKFGLSRNKAERELARLEAQGVVASEDRIDGRTGRRVKGYRRVS